MFWQFSLALRSWRMQAPVQVEALVLVPEQEQAWVLELEQALVLDRGLVLDQVRELEQGLRAQGQAAPAWVPDRGQALGKGALDPVALKDRTALVLVMEPAMAVLVLRTVRATAPVRAGMVPAPVAINSTPSSLL